MDDSTPLLRTFDEATGVLTLTLNRPERRNAIDADLWRRLRSALTEAGDDAGVRVLVLAGAGGAFCAGADVGRFGQDSSHPLVRMKVINEVALLLHTLPKPSVAKVDGVAVGAGWNLALGCDLVVATPEARFSQIFSRRALSVDFGGSWLLPRLVGPQQAKRLVMLADMIEAAEAKELGLVTWVVERAEIDGFVDDLAGRLAAGPPVALALSKALIDEGVDRSFAEALAAEGRAQAVNFAGTDLVESVRAMRNRSDDVDYTGGWVPNAGNGAVTRAET